MSIPRVIFVPPMSHEERVKRLEALRSSLDKAEKKDREAIERTIWLLEFLCGEKAP